MYNFSPKYPVKEGRCVPDLAGTLLSLTMQVSHPALRNLNFALAESMKNPFRNLFNVPSTPRCPPWLLW